MAAAVELNATSWNCPNIELPIAAILNVIRIDGSKYTGPKLIESSAEIATLLTWWLLISGSYRVNLPDGRVQTVTYKADHQGGFVADVKYEGEAIYPPEPKVFT